MTSIVIGKDRISLLESERYVSGAKQVYKLKVAFSDDWAGLNKKLVFKTDCFEVGLDVCGQCETFPMPWELFAEPTNKLQVGAYGCRRNEKVLNTRWLSLGRVLRGAIDSFNCGCGSTFPSAPSPETYKNLKDLIDRKADRLSYEEGQLILWSGVDPLSSFDFPMCGGECEGSGSCIALNAPLGAIMAWSGPINQIPDGYSLCDGQNGTRDLRNAFILGAGLNLDPGDSGRVDFLPPDEHSDRHDPCYCRPSKPHRHPSHINDRAQIDDAMTVEPVKPYYYALAYIQKTEITEADLKQGKSAYEIAVDLGFTGTEEEWIKSLEGASAYEIAVKYGYEGSEKDFGTNLANLHPTFKDLIVTRKTELPIEKSGAYHLENVAFKVGTRTRSRNEIQSVRVDDDMIYVDLRDPKRIVLTSLSNDRVICNLDSNGIIASITSETFRDQVIQIAGEGGSGKPGKSAYEIAVENGFEGTEVEWLESLKGKDGKSAYEIAVENGFEGTEQDWIDKIESGSNSGEPGKSAYEIAVENGFEGTEVEWLESLKGDPGEKGEKGDSVKMITDYTDEESLVGRYPDGRPLYAKHITKSLSSTDGEATIVTLVDVTLTSASGTFASQNGSTKCVIPGFDGAVTYGIAHDETTGDVKLYSTLESYTNREVQIMLTYVKNNDTPLTDDQLILNPIIPSEGTTDHDKLINRDRDDQHPIKAISTLTTQLAIRPSQRITEDQIKEMFK